MESWLLYQLYLTESSQQMYHYPIPYVGKLIIKEVMTCPRSLENKWYSQLPNPSVQTPVSTPLFPTPYYVSVGSNPWCSSNLWDAWWLERSLPHGMTSFLKTMCERRYGIAEWTQTLKSERSGLKSQLQQLLCDIKYSSLSLFSDVYKWDKNPISTMVTMKLTWDSTRKSRPHETLQTPTSLIHKGGPKSASGVHLCSGVCLPLLGWVIASSW